MDVGQIRAVGRALPLFLDEFGDCFGRCDTRRYLAVYVDGQVIELHRNSKEPMALRCGVPPRSLQAFLGLLKWDADRLVDRLQQHVAREHAHPWAIGVVDETGCGKDGRHTARVQRQWCGSLGKVDNRVVSVHIGYAVGNFHCVLGSDLFVPKNAHRVTKPAFRVYQGGFRIASMAFVSAFFVGLCMRHTNTLDGSRTGLAPLDVWKANRRSV